MIKFCRFAVLGLFFLSTSAVEGASYYVDDGITNGNVYTTAPGNDANDGSTPATPKRTLTNLLTSVTLAAGDIVYIDTGVYSNYTVVITNSGAVGNPIVFQGSTNVVAGGTVISRNNSSLDVIGLRGNNLEFRNLTVANGRRAFDGALQFPPPSGLVMDQVVVRGNLVALQRGQWTIRRSLFLNNNSLRDTLSSSFDFDHCVFWENASDTTSGVAPITLNNSVYVGGDLLASISGDYNVFWRVRLLNDSRAYLYQFDMPNSTVFDPGFANPSASNFYPASVSGRFNPVTGLMVTDLVHSVLIDFGNPASTAWTNEGSPNGGRVNAGAFGGTGRASLSRTNGWIFALTFNDGGAITGTSHTLRWNYGGDLATGTTVRLDYNPGVGGAWSNIVTGVSVTNRAYSWNVSSLSPMKARWRVVVESNTNIWSQNRQPFSLHGARVCFYVNNDGTNGNFYTSVPGSDLQDGLTPLTPKATLTNLLASYTLGKHDIVYIDTGVYSNYTVDVRSYGIEGQPLIFQGAPKSGATVFRRNAATSVFQMLADHHVLRYLTLENSTGNGAINGGTVTLEDSIVRNNAIGFRRVNLTARNAVIASNATVVVSDTGSFNFDRSVFWRNGQIQSTLRPWSVSNSVVVGGLFNSLPYLTGGDYTVFWEVTYDGYPNLSELQRVTQQWIQSTVLNPRFANPEAGDFYPQSIVGRYNPTIDAFVIDTNHSPVIDFGNPALTIWTNEPAPNGGRVNAGASGGTAFASKSRTNAWLQALSLNDGGFLLVPGESVYWNYGNLSTGATVRIEFSFNSGFSWNVFETNLLASVGVYTISTTNFPSSAFARWRVVLESNPAIVSTNNQNFTYRSGPFSYYVNDASLSGDIYTTAVGNDANLGTTPDSPKATISGVLTNYALGPGDVVYVDTGVYLSSGTIPLTGLAAGTNGNPVVIQGSTNVLAGGTIIRGPTAGAANAPGFTFSSGVQDIDIRDIIVQRKTIGVSLNNNTRIGLTRMRIESNYQAGVSAVGVNELNIRHTAIRANLHEGLLVSGGGEAAVIHSAVWMNGTNAIRTAGTRVMVTNSVLGARGAWNRIYDAPSRTNIIANYNSLWVENEASVARVGGLDRMLNTLSAWQSESGMDTMSLDVNPRFVNADAGDFHLRSQTIQGRFDPLLGWVTDTVTSSLIDAGDPASSFAHESEPNGGRANIGIYGNTPSASRADFSRLFVGNLVQGGHVKGTSILHWVAAGPVTQELVRVDVSLNGGESWTPLTTGVMASAEQYVWDVTLQPPAVAGLWRIQSVENPSIQDQSTNFFGVRNAPLTYYVNDASTNGTVFTTGPGSPTNWVASTSRPLNSLALLFERYDLEPQDRVYVDRGVYSMTSAWFIGARDSGAPTSGVVTVVGATECPDGVSPVSELVGSGGVGQLGVLLDQARHVVVSNLIIRQMGTALSVSGGQSLALDGLRMIGSATNTVVMNMSSNILFRRSLFAGSASYGWSGISNVNIQLVNSIFVSNKLGAVSMTGGSMGITNSVFLGTESGVPVFTVVNNGLIRSDYNNFRVAALANVALYNGRLHKTLASWQQTTTNDLRSLSHDPGFASMVTSGYRLQSVVGRKEGSCSTVTDAVHSVMIDSGDPAFSAGLEPIPNGGRINLGIYGGSAEASLSSTNGRLLTLSLNSGGTVRGTNTLYWSANQAVTGHLVYIDVSFDNGVTWTNIATNLNASSQSFLWNASELDSNPLGRWRIGSQSDPSLTATTEVAFTLNNGSIGYFVNDTNTSGDVYTTAPGAPDNDGLSADTPVTSINAIFSRYQPGPGDIIYIDTGEYEFSATVFLDENNNGQATNPVVIQGSTNWIVGGSKFNMKREGPLFQISGGQGFAFSDLTLTNTRYGFITQVSSNLVFSRITVSGATNFSDSAGLVAAGFRFDSSSHILLERVIVAGITNRSTSAGILIRQTTGLPGSLTVKHSVLWENAHGLWAQAEAPISLSNSIVHANGANAIGLRLRDLGGVSADYNTYRIEAGGKLAELNRIISTQNPVIRMPYNITTIQSWRENTGLDTNSLTYDPRFANPSLLDFGLMSTSGRWTPDGLVTDAVSSLLIDAGNPGWEVLNEPAPNGNRVNMGPDANSERASLSPTNRSIVLVSFNDGGVARGTNVLLRWDLRGDFTGDTFLVQVSQNMGQSWMTLTSGVPAGQLQVRWNSTEWASGFNRMWRMVSQLDPALSAQSERPFAVRNTNVVFYVNNASMTGVVYTTGIGISTNSGLLPSQPKPAIEDIFNTYTVVGGDTIYVDTGVYPSSGGVVVEPRDDFPPTGLLSIIGSTNRSFGGTILQNGGFLVRNARDVAIQHFRVSGTLPAGMNIISSTNIQATWFHSTGSGFGIYLQNAVDVSFRHSSVVGAITNGIRLFAENRRIVFDHGVIWNSLGDGVNPVNSIAISNSVLAASGVGRFIHIGSSNQSLNLNHNMYYITNGARLARLAVSPTEFPREFNNLAAWRNFLQADSGSMMGDPRFADAANQNFHPRSSGGRWSDAITNFVIDDITSPLVDSGSPAAAFGLEPNPNGNRVNIGLYGNTPFASKSPADPDYLLVSLNDGGSVSGTNVVLSWVARGTATSHNVRVEFSLDGGAIWSVLASNVPPSSAMVSWNTTGLLSTVAGLWRVTSEESPAVSATSEQYFAVRNGPVILYINDNSVVGNVYTTTQGLNSATGIYPSSPLDSLQTLLSRYALEPGDIVYMDTGVYTNTATILIDQLDAGFRLIGSTNEVAGGTELVFTNTSVGLRLFQAPNTRIDHIRFGVVPTAVSVENSLGVILNRLEIKGSDVGVRINQSSGVTVQNSSIRNGSTGIFASQSTGLQLNHLVLWSNHLAGVRLSLASATMNHSVVGSYGGSDTMGIDLDATSTWTSDYNMFARSDDAVIARRDVAGTSFDLRWQRVATWSRETGNDVYSLSGGDPGFADPAMGNFHLVSSAGRYDRMTGLFTNDSITSVLIDAGLPVAPFDRETFPNGSRANIGMYGNTSLASRSPTNARLTVVRLNDGGRAEGGSVPLSWVATGAATGHTVRLDYSVDNGASWSVIQSNVTADAELLFWDSETNATWFGRWRVVSEQDPNISATNVILFTLRNKALALYMNDVITVGDVYTTAPGDSANTGTTPDQPRLSLQSLLDDYDLEPGDTIYVDTGEYIVNSPIIVGRFDAWNDMNNLNPLAAGGTSVRIMGSTNDAANGSRFLRAGSGSAIELQNALGLHLSRLDLRHIQAGGGNTLVVDNSPYALVEWCRFSGGSLGISVSRSDRTRMRHVLVRNSTQRGVQVRNSINVDLQNSVLWSNTVGMAVDNQGHVRARNNVVVALAPNSVGWLRNDGPQPISIGTLEADYNLLWSTPDAFIAQLLGTQYPAGTRRFQRMFVWNSETGLDLYSLKSDPLFADPIAGDFHPRSPFGRYLAGTGYLTNAAEAYSPLIDTGDPNMPFGGETLPNGQRVNIGLYGNSAQSSLSASNGSLQVITFRDGGSSSGEIFLRWAVSGAAANHPVTLDFSNDGGSTWTNIASNVLASAQSLLWDSEPFGRAAAGVWRITSQTDSMISSQTERFFSLRQDGTIPYYINDASIVGDVYCTAPGNDANTGFLPSTPKATLQSLLNDIDLEPGDIVYMDTGSYVVNLNTVWGELDRGSSTNPIVLRGSTNILAGGTVMDRVTGQGSALVISRTEGITIENISFVRGENGLSVEASQFVRIHNVTAKDNSLAGIRVAGSRDTRVENCLLWNNPTNGFFVGALSVQVGQQVTTFNGSLIARNNTIWGSRYGVTVNLGGAAELHNNLIRVNGPESRVYFLDIGVTNVVGDYNAYFRQSGALMAERAVQFGGNEFYPRLIDWQGFAGRDLRTLSHDPKVANAVSGDFHLQSATGRFLSSGALTNDAPGEFSPLIDTGDPLTVWTNEPAPNGGRVNIGRFGGTTEASMSRTNGWLLALTMNDGGRYVGTNVLRWAAGSWPTSSMVRLEYANNGVDFAILATNVPVYQDGFTWDASGEPITQLARWRVVSEDDPAISSQVQTPFVIKPVPLVVYVNNGSTNGNVYTFAEGSSTNSGLTPFDPLDDPGVALEKFPFSEGDILYIDTGTYSTTNTFCLRLGLIGDNLKTGNPGQPIRIIGSTNQPGGGSVILPFVCNQYGIQIINTKHISIESITFSGFSNGVMVAGSTDVSIQRVRSFGNASGFVMSDVVDGRIMNSAAWNNQRYGIEVAGANSSVLWNHGVLWSNQIAAVRHVFGSLAVSNSILGAASPTGLIYQVNSQFATTRGNFNLYATNGNPVLFLDIFGGVGYQNIRRWQNASGMDFNSFVTDPLFANPGAGDFHLRSDQGRFVPATDSYIQDPVTSWGIDAGALGHDFGLEPMPNGGRLNIGLYGNTREASLSSPTPGLFVVSLRDGGTAASPQPLVWLARGMAATNTVRIEYTPNNGVGWVIVATNIPAMDQNYLWINDELDSTPLGRWRIILESNDLIQDITEVAFKVRNGPILYYVNDTNLVGDVYTVAPGASINNGITVSTPVHSVSAIIDRYELEGGDVIYVDTGFYFLTSNIVIRADDAGVVTNRMVIQGSTNWMDGGTRLFRQLDRPWSSDAENDDAVFKLVRAANIEIGDMVLENANAGILISNPQPQEDRLLLRNLIIRNGGSFGIRLRGSSGNQIRRVVVQQMEGVGIAGDASTSFIDSSVMWSNRLGSVTWVGGTVAITNSVLHAFGSITNAIIKLNDAFTRSDYNNYFQQGEAVYGMINGEPVMGLPQWTQATTQDLHTISADPLFADPDNGDFHPLSPAGRYDPLSDSFVTEDTVFSWLIDTGDPGTSYTNEPMPNGLRRNIGLFGGTIEASKSRSDPWLLAVTAMAGGRIGGIFPLHWFYGNIDSTNRVNLDYSADGGTNWFSIATGIPINTDGYLWNSENATPFNQSPITKWRVLLVGDTNTVDETPVTFGLNGPFRFFLNATNSPGDVFTTAPGNDANLGISSNAPKATLRAILDSWDLDPLDSIYVDTGTYVFNSNDVAVVRLNNRGDSGAPVSIYGSTNGAVFDGSPLVVVLSPTVILEINAPYVEVNGISVLWGNIEARGTNVVLRNMKFDNANVKLSGQFGILESFSMSNGVVQATGPDMIIRSGLILEGAMELEGTRALMENSVIAGTKSPLVIVGGTNISLINNTLVGGRTAIQQKGADSRSVVRNNIIIANGISGTGLAIERLGGVVESDYNLFSLRNGAWYGTGNDGLWERLLYWQQNSSNDMNSLVSDPLFANEAAGNFRLRSTVGRYDNGIWVVDGVNSPAIDAGAPFDSFAGEPAPNGARINIGAYGNTAQASKSRTSPWLYAISMNDGGVIRGTETLRWLAGGMDSTNRVTLQYSWNAGATWETIATGLPSAAGAYQWDSTTASNSLDALWRVVLDADPLVLDETDSIFNIRNDIRAFYVNNATTNGNVYTTAPGNALNDGRTPATPKASLEDLFATYDTEPYDIVYVDTGIYTSSVIQIIWSRGGATNANMTIQGSTNVAAGGSVIRRPNKSGDALVVNASFVTVRNLILENAGRGLVLASNNWNVIEQVGVRSNLVGIAVDSGHNHVIRSSWVWNSTTGGINIANANNVVVENITYVNNNPHSVRFDTVVNSVIQSSIFYLDQATSNTQFAIAGPTGSVLNAFIDYNVYYFGPKSASNAFIYGSFNTLLPWQRLQSKDFRSAITNPLLNNVESGDFHPQSQAGRYSPLINDFVLDAQTSWAVDKGNPFSVFSQETMENGGRINIGAYGNTYYASRGVTNELVYVRTGNEFLPISENENPYPLIWYLLNVPFDFNVSVQYSGDGGNEWVTLESGVPAYQEYIVWTNSPIYNSFNARWRIVGEGPGNTNYWDINDGKIQTFFGVHRISSITPQPGNVNRIVWRGAWDEDYQIQYATNFISTNKLHNWLNLGGVTNLVIGGDTPFIDAQSTQDVFRVYRVLWLGTNGVGRN